MIIAGIYSFNHGREIIEEKHPGVFEEVQAITRKVDSEPHRVKASLEKSRKSGLLYSPRGLNRAFKTAFHTYDWKSHREPCQYSTDYYTDEYRASTSEKLNLRPAYREMDFVKNRVGVEVQFGKYAFMVYNVAAKMTIFHKLNVIDVGVEIVPIKAFAIHMSTGVSYFEQFVWDLEHRGIADIDIPVLVLGVMSSTL